MKRWPVWVAVFVLPWLWASGAQAQSIPYSHDFEATDTAFHLWPTGDTLAWKTNQGGGVSGSRCLLSEYVTNSAGANADKSKVFGVKIADIPAGVAYSLGMQLGPDNKIYLAKPYIGTGKPTGIVPRTNQQLGVIHFPDVLAGGVFAPTCGFSWEGVSLPNDTKFCRYGLPNFSDATDLGPFLYLEEPVQTVESGVPLEFTYDLSAPGSRLNYTVEAPPGIEGATSCTLSNGCGDAFSATLTNTTACPLEVVYTFVATEISPAGGCTGPPVKLRVIVSPVSPLVQLDNSPTTICSNGVFVINSAYSALGTVKMWATSSAVTGLPTGTVDNPTSVSYTLTNPGTEPEEVVFHFQVVTMECNSAVQEVVVTVDPCKFPLVSTCDPEDDHHIVLHPEEEETSGTVYQWQSFVGLEWVDYQASWSLELDPAVVEDRLYRLKITPATGPSSFSSPFHTYGHGSGNSYAGSLPSDGYPVYFIQGNGDITGNLTVDGTLLRMKGMSSYNSEAPGGTVEGTFLTVKPGATLTIQNHSTVESACQNMWGGFILEVPSTGSAHAGISVDASSEIRDAWTGIGATEITSTVNRPSIDVQGAHFTNCYMGIKIGAPASGSYLKNNTFVSAYDEMKAPFDWERNQAFRPAKGDDEDNKSAPDPTGLVAKYVSLLGIMFTEPFSFSSNGHFTGNSFNNMAFGVFCDFSNSTFNSAIHPVVSGNTFEKCHLASVLARGCGNIEVSGCSLTVNSTQDELFTHLMDGAGAAWVGNDHVNPPLIPILNTYGIHLAGCTSAVERKVTGNVLVSSNQNLPYLFHHGTKVGAEATNELTYTGNQVTGFHFGLNLSQQSGTAKATINGNTFTDNRTAIWLNRNGNTGTATMDFTLKCNTFEQTTTIPTGQTRTGLLIGEGVSLENGRIGGTLLTEPQSEPNSNYFPRTMNATTGAIEPFPGYFSVWNESENQIFYYNYGNEDLGHYYPISGSSPIVPVPQLELTITRKNLEIWCEAGTPPRWQSNGYVTFSTLPDCRAMTLAELETLQTNPGPPNSPMIPALWKLACQGGSLDNIAFPIPRPAAVDEETTTQIHALQETGAFLGQSIPNPAQDKVTIPVMLPFLQGSVLLEVFELSTGKALTSKAIPGFGQHMVEINTHNWASGMYGYRVVLSEGKSPSPRKMVILR